MCVLTGKCVSVCVCSKGKVCVLRGKMCALWGGTCVCSDGKRVCSEGKGVCVFWGESVCSEDSLTVGLELPSCRPSVTLFNSPTLGPDNRPIGTLH